MLVHRVTHISVPLNTSAASGNAAAQVGSIPSVWVRCGHKLLGISKSKVSYIVDNTPETI